MLSTCTSRSGVLNLIQAALLCLAALYTLYFAQDFLIPVTAAVILALAFGPLVRKLARRGLPSPVSAGAIVVALIMLIGTGIWQLSDSASEWLARAPVIISELEYRLRDIREPVEKAKEATEQVQKMAEIGNDPAAPADVVVKPPSILENFLGKIRNILVQGTIALILLFFLLASGEAYKVKLITALSDRGRRQQILSAWRKVERDVSAYLATVSTINIGFGVFVASGLYIVEMPNALLWGAMATGLNFVPYIGALVGVTVITVVSIITFDALSYAFVPPAIYAALNILEAHFVTPMILGNRFALQTAVVFISVVFGGWLWGAPGALLAIPVLLTAKAVFEQSQKMSIIAELLTPASRRSSYK